MRINKESLLFIYYQNKHLIYYILIGIFSISAELYVKNLFFIQNDVNNINNYFIPFSLGVIICFSLNFFLNFNIPNYFFFISLLYFFIISILSYSFQYYVSVVYDFSYISFEKKRFLIAGIFFIFGYILHRKFSFKYTKKIGIALYPNNKTDINAIYNDIGLHPDLIHIDLVDKSINSNADDIEGVTIEKIRKLWSNHEKQIHIISKKPTYLINKYVIEKDVVFVHHDIEENPLEVFRLIKNKNAIPGIVIHIKKDSKFDYNLIKGYEEVLFLCIDNPGFSGQKFNQQAQKLIKEFNIHPIRKRVTLSVDGGVSLSLIPFLKSDKAISSSDILNSKRPKIQIMKLKTLSRYQR